MYSRRDFLALRRARHPRTLHDGLNFFLFRHHVLVTLSTTERTEQSARLYRTHEWNCNYALQSVFRHYTYER